MLWKTEIRMRNDPTLWMNVTTSSKWNRSPVGIVRVEQEIRRHLRKILGDRLQPIVLDEGRFICEGPTSVIGNAEIGDFWPEPSFGSSLDLFGPIKSRAPIRSAFPPAKCIEPRFAHGDILITMGLDWDYPDLLNEIRRCANRYGLVVISCCYDLIPILFPQFCVGDVASWFKQYLIDMTWLSDGILCISENTRRDYLNLASSIGLPARRTEVIKLGSSLPVQTQGQPLSKDVDKVLNGRYFLFVSTIERRKNHEILYRAYHLIRQDHPSANLPKLVFVGMEGWGVADLMSDIRLDPLTKDDIVILPHVSDAELLRLYAECEVFLYPSLYEGWGLPIAEALQLGRPVLASDVGSIPEVGGDLVRYVDPWSPRVWADELLKISNGEADLDSWSKRIRRRFVAYNWSSAAETLIGLAHELVQTKDSTLVLDPGYDLSTPHGVHYGAKIIYHGSQGIVCHGPYIALSSGRHEVCVQIDWIEPAAGVLQIKAAHKLGESSLAKKKIRTASLRLGRNEIVLPVDVPDSIDDFEVICVVDCATDVKLSIDKIWIRRLGVVGSASQRISAA